MDTSPSALLLGAAASGDTALVARALVEGADVDAADARGKTALIKAALRGHVEITETLVVAGASLELMWERTALGAAVFSGHQRIVRRLTTAGASMDCVGNNGDSALMLAIRHDRSSILDLLLAVGASVDVVNWRDETALFLACQMNYSTAVQKLLEAGADVNFVNKRGSSALLAAVSAGHADVVAILIANGADVNMEAPHLMFLERAIKGGHVGVVKHLLAAGAYARGSGQRPLIDAAHRGSADIVRLLLHAGADSNRVDEKNESALTIAAARGYEDVVDELLSDDRVEINHANNDGYTALMQAATVEILDQLLENGADPRVANTVGETALHLATRHGNATFIERLLITKTKMDGRHCFTPRFVVTLV